MEIKINAEISDYRETVALGLDIYQIGFSLAAVICSLAMYFSLKDTVGAMALSYMIIASSAPFAFLGFFRYNGMSAFKFIRAYLIYLLFEKGTYLLKTKNLYYSAIQGEKCKTR